MMNSLENFKRSALILLVLSLWLNPTVLTQGEDNSGPRYHGKLAARAKLSEGSACLAGNELSKTVAKLSSPKYQERAAAENLLLNRARRSPDCKKRIVSALIEAMTAQGDDFTRDRAAFDFWEHGSNLLADLKATEALDLLIMHFEVKGRPSVVVYKNMLVRAVIKIGLPAIPKLIATLNKSTDRYLRRDVVFCLADIGGAAAQRALSDALPRESDACVKSFIQASLRALTNKKHPNHIAANDRLKWYASVLSCD